MSAASEEECANLCWRMEDCNAWTYQVGTDSCFPKTGSECYGDASGWTFGSAGCGAPGEYGGKEKNCQNYNNLKMLLFEGFNVEPECDLSIGQYKCGNLCMDEYDVCLCGNVELSGGVYKNYCCVNPGEQCFREEGGNVASCPTGQTLKIDQPCHQKCYGDYNTSESFSYFSSQYTCDGETECLSVSSMCQGLSWCGETKDCNRNLKCSQIGDLKTLQSDVVREHSFCLLPSHIGTSSYDVIDRTDEETVNTFDIRAVNIDYQLLTKCDNHLGDPGITCYYTDSFGNLISECTYIGFWCRMNHEASCIVHKSEKTTISTSNKHLCQNTSFWNDVDPDYYASTEKIALGRKCNGTQQHFIYTWYNYYNGNPENFLKQNCDDKSDRIFKAGVPCQNSSEYIKIHNDNWCSPPYVFYVNHSEICSNPTSWVENHPDQSRMDDPHFCQDSCSKPGPNCEACSNSNYFLCSGLCIHPELVCDGHPQCPNNEDEEFSLCKDKYLSNKIVAPFASFKCFSKMYPAIFTIATACNDVEECFGGLDEISCGDDSKTTPFLIISIIAAVTIFVGLKIPQVIDWYYIKQIKSNERKFDNEKNFESILQEWNNGSDNVASNRRLNSSLLHILHTRKTTVFRALFIKFYDTMADKYENDEGKMFSFLKDNINHCVTSEIVDIKFKGLKWKIIDQFEESSGTKWLSSAIDKVTKYPSLRLALSTLSTLLSILSHFIDIVKDSLLTVSLLVIIGGPQAIVDFPTNFSSAVVMAWLGTILVPILASSLNLGLTNPFLVFDSTRLKAMKGGRVVAAIGCMLLSPFNTVVLKTNLEICQQQVIEAARDEEEYMLDLFKKQDEIEKHLQEYLQTELGIYVQSLNI